MRERQKQSGYAYGNGGKGVDQMNHTFEDKTSKRKELAKIANTSEGSIQRTTLRTTLRTPKGTLVTIVKYEDYQVVDTSDEPTLEPTNEPTDRPTGEPTLYAPKRTAFYTKNSFEKY